MVKRFQNLDVYQKGILILLVAMTVVFAFVYAATIARMGYLYQEEIFVPTEENGTTVYSGKLDDMECRFEVTAEKKLTFHTEEKVYGPYTAKEDPTAIPEDDSFSELMTGVEVREGDEIRFRGGIFDMTGDGSYMILIREDWLWRSLRWFPSFLRMSCFAGSWRSGSAMWIGQSPRIGRWVPDIWAGF